jgi:hypothetical protein
MGYVLWTFALAVVVLTEAQGTHAKTHEFKVGSIVRENQMLRKQLAQNDEKLKSALGEPQQKEQQPAGKKVSTTYSSQQRGSEKQAAPQEEAEPAEKKAPYSSHQHGTQKSQKEDKEPATKKSNQDERITVGFPGDEMTVDFPKDECKKQCWKNKEDKGCEEQCDYDSASNKDRNHKSPTVSIEDDMDPFGLPLGIPGMPGPNAQELLSHSAASDASFIGLCAIAVTSVGLVAAFIVHAKTRPAPIARPLLG